MSLKDKVKGKMPKQITEPVWKGPTVDGVTQSMLGRYLACKERFRLKVIEGLQPVPEFNPRLEYGNLWHAAEEAHAAHKPTAPAIVEAGKKLSAKYPLQSQQVKQWVNICQIQFPYYVEYWSRHPDVKDRKPICQEGVFSIPYHLPSGRTVLLRGKFDSVDLIGKGRQAAVYLQENKTKGDIDEEDIKKNLTFDLQTMFYMTALKACQVQRLEPFDSNEWGMVAGVRYNVIRRPLGGGLHSIKQRKGRETKNGRTGVESDEEFMDRLAQVIKENQQDFFMRWKVDITASDLLAFQRTCLNPVLENLVDDYSWWNYDFTNKQDPFNYIARREMYKTHQSRHYRFPYGVYNPTMEGRSSDLDYFLQTGSEVGLQRTDELFPELQEL